MYSLRCASKAMLNTRLKPIAALFTTHNSHVIKGVAVGVIGFCLPHSTVMAAEALATEVALKEVLVIAAAPIAGMGQAKDTIPAAIQTTNAKQIRETQSIDISSLLSDNFSGVHVNDNVGNPFQMDVNYRGYTASPLLGTPQGLSVYMDGVRMNQAFGDVVLWELIPRSVIQNMTLVPGSNPVFGLNTLGGAISVQTKDGLSYRGTEIEAGIGSNGRYAVEVETGGKNDKGLNWYFFANQFQEHGWRDASPSKVQQLFGKVGWKHRDSQVKLTYAYNNSSLTGNGPQQQDLLAASYNSVLTTPDTTRTQANFVNLEGKTALTDDVLLSANAYYRKTNTTTFNGNLNTNASPTHGGSYDAALNAETNCLNANGDPQSANAMCNGLLVNAQTKQNNFGVSAQADMQHALSWGTNRLLVGAALDMSQSRFTQNSGFGYLNADRSFNALGLSTQGSEADNTVDLRGKTLTWGVYASDTASFLNKKLHLTAAARFNHTRLNNIDQLNPIPDPDPTRNTSLSGTHTYQRFNPAIGLTATPTTAFNPYLNYSESSRAPTSIELGCANPYQSCSLPTSLAGDPDLKQVVTKTWELGARGQLLDKQLNWQAGLFYANSENDILFVMSPNNPQQGYFTNFGKTRRAGAELGLVGTFGKLNLGVNYTYLNATYQSAQNIPSPFNAAADAQGNVQVHPGNTIPLNPHHILNLRMRYRFTPQLSSGLTLNILSRSYAAGNENNKDSAKVPGYAVLNWQGNYNISKHFTLFGSVNNVFNRRYATSGSLGNTSFTADGQYNTNGGSSVLYTPGAPRAFWLGLRYQFD